MNTQTSNEQSAAACPDCGCALLQEHELTEDAYSAELRFLESVSELVFTRACWFKGIENHELLVGCTRCEAPLNEHELVAASDDEETGAWSALRKLQESVSGVWEARDDGGSVGECSQCGSREFVIRVERTVPLAAVYFFEDGSPERSDHGLLEPWSVDWAFVGCVSCPGTKTLADVAWRVC
jgi:hypothetical protein